LPEQNERAQAREIVIDGPNVAMDHSNSMWPASAKGIELAINYYLKLGWTVRAIVPRYFLGTKGKRRADNPELLEKLQKAGHVYTIPSQDHDDNYWIAYALQTGAFVVTNDRMKDHSEKHPGGDEAFFRWRDEKVISYAFVGDTFLPNPEFKLPNAPTVVKEEKEKSVSQQKGQKRKPAKRQKPKKPLQKDLKGKFISTIRSHLSSKKEENLQSLSQHILRVVKRTDGSEYPSIKEMMSDMGLARSRPFYFQLEKLMGKEIEIVKKNGSPHSAKLSEKANRVKPKKQRKSKRLTMAQFKQALGEKNEEIINVPKNELPEVMEKGFEMLCNLDFPINVAEVGNRFKDITGVRLSTVFNKMNKLAFFLSTRPECKCGNVVTEDSFLHCREKESVKKENSKFSWLPKWLRWW